MTSTPLASRILAPRLRLPFAPLLLALVATLFAGCASTLDLTGWNAQSENVTSMRLVVESEGTDFNAYPMADGYIFWSDRTGNTDVWMIRGTGIGTNQLTTGSGQDLYPTPLPNGREFVFLSDRAGESELYYYIGEVGKPTARSLVPVSKPSIGSWGPAYMDPAGKTLLYTSGNNIWLYNTDTRDKTQLTEGYDASWSPDGRQIVFTRVARDLGSAITMSIWIMNRDGTGLTELIPGDSEVSVGHPRISPDGSRIAYHRSVIQGRNMASALMGRLVLGDRSNIPTKTLSNADIWVSNLDGTGATQLTTHPLTDANPNWVGSDQIIFSSERPSSGVAKDANWDIWLMSL